MPQNRDEDVAVIIVLARLVGRNDLPADHETRERRMREIVEAMPGYLGVKHYTSADDETISLWRFASEDALEAWRMHAEHVEAQEYGR